MSWLVEENQKLDIYSGYLCISGNALSTADSTSPRPHAVHVGQVPHQHDLLALVHPPARIRAHRLRGQEATEGGARIAAEDAQVLMQDMRYNSLLQFFTPLLPI